MATILTKPDVDISSELKKMIKEHADEKGQVVVHVKVGNDTNHDNFIRIWPTTYLYDQGSAHISDLVHIENIVYYPLWQICPKNVGSHFTLVFSGLPKSCTTFDLIEHCTNQGGAFEVHSIPRNESDVYYVQI